MLRLIVNTSCFIFLWFFGSNVANCQTVIDTTLSDTTRYEIFAVFAETGVFFLNSNDFKNVYNSHTAFNWSLGLHFGSSLSKFLPWMRYSHYQSKIDTIHSTGTDDPDTTGRARRRQISFGFIHPIEFANTHFIQLKYGVSRNFITEELTGLDTRSTGILMSVGYMRRFSEYFTYYIDLGYDYTKTPIGTSVYFKDWSGFMINYGVSFNLAAE